MKKLLCFHTTHAGATTLASTLVSEDGELRAGAAFVAPKKFGITKITVTGVAPNYALISRNSHQASPMTLNANVAAATLNYNVHGYDFISNIGKGVILDKDETLSVTTTATGAGVMKVVIELDDSCPTTDFRAVRVAGSTLLVVDTPTETGALVPVGLMPSVRYAVAFANLFAAVTTNYAFLKNSNGGSVHIGVPQSSALPAQVKWLTPDQQRALSGTGTDMSNQLKVFFTDTVATAAATQVLNIGFAVV